MSRDATVVTRTKISGGGQGRGKAPRPPPPNPTKASVTKASAPKPPAAKASPKPKPPSVWTGVICASLTSGSAAKTPQAPSPPRRKFSTNWGDSPSNSDCSPQHSPRWRTHEIKRPEPEAKAKPKPEPKPDESTKATSPSRTLPACTPSSCPGPSNVARTASPPPPSDSTQSPGTCPRAARPYRPPHLQRQQPEPPPELPSELLAAAVSPGEPLQAQPVAQALPTQACGFTREVRPWGEESTTLFAYPDGPFQEAQQEAPTMDGYVKHDPYPQVQELQNELWARMEALCKSFPGSTLQAEYRRISVPIMYLPVSQCTPYWA